MSEEETTTTAETKSAEKNSCQCGNCEMFVSNPFKKNKCIVCQCEASKHEGLTDEQMLTASIARNDTVPNKILDEGLFIGSFQGSMNLKFLKEANITHVVCCAQNLKLVNPKFKQYPEKGIKYLNLDLLDDVSVTPKTDLLGPESCTRDSQIPREAKLDEAGALNTSYQFIDEALNGGGHVLVHCAQGVSRSGAILVGYMMRKQGLTYDQAMKIVKPKRPIVEPNHHFKSQLRVYERILKQIQ
jgi:protein-tyrosine phosphatase